MSVRRLNVKTFIISHRPTDRLSAWHPVQARTSSVLAVPTGRVAFGGRRLTAPIVVVRTALIAFLETASFAARAARPTYLHAARWALKVHVAGLAPRTPDPRRSYSPFALLVPPPPVAQMAPIEFVTHPAAAGPDHSRTEWAVSSAVPSRSPVTSAPALAERSNLRRLYSPFIGTEGFPPRGRRRAFRAMLMLHAVV